jgi:hypothetical protein
MLLRVVHPRIEPQVRRHLELSNCTMYYIQACSSVLAFRNNLLHISPSDPILGVGLLCNLIILSERPSNAPAFKSCFQI